MKRGSTLFLRGAILAIGTAVLALCIFALPSMWAHVPEEYSGMPHVLYIILLAMYTSAIPFFIALYQALRLLGYVDKSKAFSTHSIKALQWITWCAVAISIVYAASLPFFYIWADTEDAPGLLVIGMVMMLAPLTIGVFAAVLRRLFQEAIKIKSENDLTV